MKKKWLSVLLAATMVSGNAVSTTSVFAMDDFSDAVQETETSEEPEEEPEPEDFVDVNLDDQEGQEEDESSVDVRTDAEEEESFPVRMQELLKHPCLMMVLHRKRQLFSQQLKEK